MAAAEIDSLVRSFTFEISLSKLVSISKNEAYAFLASGQESTEGGDASNSVQILLIMILATCKVYRILSTKTKL